MALSNSGLDSVATNTIGNKINDSIFTSNALTTKLIQPGKKRVVDGGLAVQEAIGYQDEANTTGGWFSGSEVFDQSEYDPFTSAVFNWKQIYELVKLSHIDLAKASGDTAKINWMAARIDWARKAMMNRLGASVYSDGTGSSSKEITGLGAVMSTSSTYGGIAVADVPTWIAVILENSSVDRPLSLSLLQRLKGSCTEGNDKPDMGSMRQNVMDELVDLLQPHQRIVGEDQELSKLGYKGDVLNYSGVKYIVDSNSAAQKINLLNTNYFKLAFLKRRRVQKSNSPKS
jgi:hypothetical protein